VSALRYVYGIAPAGGALAIDSAQLEGIEGGRVRSITEGELLAALSDVDSDVYDSAPLNEHIRDLDWLTPRAAAHQAVNGRLLELLGTVLPLSFGAIYRDDDRVRQMLGDDATERASRLRDLEGRAEWVLTLTRDAAAPADEDEIRTLDAQIATSAPGRAFLLEKRRSSTIARTLERHDAEAADEAMAAMDEVAEKSYREAVASAGTDVVVLRASILVPRAREKAVAGAIERAESVLAERGYRLRASGPWPAYRFGGMP